VALEAPHGLPGATEAGLDLVGDVQAAGLVHGVDDRLQQPHRVGQDPVANAREDDHDWGYTSPTRSPAASPAPSAIPSAIPSPAVPLNTSVAPVTSPTPSQAAIPAASPNA
jgi:hypothetical protein